MRRRAVVTREIIAILNQSLAPEHASHLTEGSTDVDTEKTHGSVCASDDWSFSDQLPEPRGEDSKTNTLGISPQNTQCTNGFFHYGFASNLPGSYIAWAIACLGIFPTTII